MQLRKDKLDMRTKDWAENKASGLPLRLPVVRQELGQTDPPE